MNRIARLALFGMMLVPSGLQSQQITMSRVEGEVIGIALGQFAIVKAVDGGIVVDNVTVDSGATGPRVDLRSGDRIAALQQIPVATMEAFLASYRSLTPGSVVVLKLRRGSADVDVRFPKPAPQQRVMAVGGGGVGAPAGAWTVAGAGNASAFAIAGTHIMENKDGMPEVSHMTSHPAAAMVTLRVGDVITRINESPIAALLGLQMVYDKLQADSEVKLTVQRGTQTVVVAFRKPAAR